MTTPDIQNQIGNNTTKSTPFVTADGWVWFQGTDDRLYKVFNDGSQFSRPGANDTTSSPTVVGGWVYFQGDHNKLFKMLPDGSAQTQIGNSTTASSPFVTASGVIYFRGTDNKLYKVNSDGSGKTQIGNNTTKSTPFVTADGWVWFQGTDDRLYKVFNDGSQFSRPGANDTASSPIVGRVEISEGTVGEWIYFQSVDNKLTRLFQPVDPIASGTMRPKYYVLTVLYSPPGTNGGKSSSVVDYSSGSSTGTTTSTSSAFKKGISVSAGLKVLGGSGVPSPFGLSGQFSASTTTTDETTEDIKKSQTYDIKVPGPGKDGIDHDHDIFMLMLNPLVAVNVYPGNNILWTMGVDGEVENIQEIYVAWLKNPSTMAPGVKQLLDAAGLTATDYAQILSNNPFANGASSIDPNRFLPLPQSFPYEPPLTSADPVVSITDSFQNTVTITNKHTVETQYDVSVTISSGFDIAKILELSLSSTGSMQWTNTNSLSTNTIDSQSAAATVGGPAFGYSGPTDVLAYWDSIYNSFMFAFTSEPPAASGTLLDSAGKPVALKAVTLTVGGHTFKTFTNPRGQYRFYGATGGNGSLAVDGQNFAVPIGPGAAPPTLRLH
jgi:Domain of unknown function (DUF5050)